MLEPLILHAADLHVGDSRNLPQYLERQRTCLYGLTDLCCAHGVKLALYCGDIFDSKHLRPRERDVFLDWLINNDITAQEYGFNVVLMPGNHDEIEQGYTHLHGYRALVTERLLGNTTIVVEPTLLWFDHIAVAVVPPGFLDDVDGTVRRFYAEFEASGKAEVGYFVVMLHAPVVGASNEIGTYRVSKGVRIRGDMPVTYWALGDIHKPFQAVLPNAWYPGSPMQHDFGDVTPKRGALLVNLDLPTAPTPLYVEAVTPLITLDAVPEQWPTDAIVRFIGDAGTMASTDFPSNVVKFDPSVEPPEIRVDDPLDGLTDAMVAAKVPTGHHGEVAELLRSLL